MLPGEIHAKIRKAGSKNEKRKQEIMQNSTAKDHMYTVYLVQALMIE
jgi:hypothetical protein